MWRLSDELLIETLNKAITQELSIDFIELLVTEINRRTLTLI